MTNALSLRNGGSLEMERPGYVEKEFQIKSLSTNTNKTLEKIITAFITKGDKLCFLIKWKGINKCDVVSADDCNKQSVFPLNYNNFYPIYVCLTVIRNALSNIIRQNSDSLKKFVIFSQNIWPFIRFRFFAIFSTFHSTIH